MPHTLKSILKRTLDILDALHPDSINFRLLLRDLDAVEEADASPETTDKLAGAYVETGERNERKRIVGILVNMTEGLHDASYLLALSRAIAEINE